MNQLVRHDDFDSPTLYEDMCRAIEAVHKVDEARKIRSKAAALEEYARQALNLDAERKAVEIRLRAERKAGQLLAQMDRSKGGGEKGVGRRGKNAVDQHDSIPTLEELGISRDQSSQWQKMGAIPQDEFDELIGSSDKIPSTASILRATAPPKPGPKVKPEALWLWGRLMDFERDGLLARDPADVLMTMTDLMLDDVHRLAPKVATWLRKIGAL
jgi:hypothetical protein